MGALSVSSSTSDFSIGKEVIRIGESDITKNVQRAFDYEFYSTSALTEIDLVVESPPREKPIDVPFKAHVEVELHFKPLELNTAGFDPPSRFEIRSEQNDYAEPVLHAGGSRSWKVENHRAIASFAPWVYVPYGDGGIVTLSLILQTDSGEEFRRDWIFKVGKNPAISN